MRILHAAIILCILMAMMTAVSWQMWLNPAIDSGREMNTPQRLLDGELLYSQVYYLHGPVAPYVNAGLYALFGRHLNSLYWAGIFGSLLLVLSVFHLGCRFMPPFQAMLAGGAVLALCIFKETGNTIFPYSYAVLYGTLSGTFALIALVRYCRTNRHGSLFPAGILSGLAFCCKTEFGIAVIASLLAVIITTPRERRLRVCRRLLPGFMIFPILFGVFLFVRIPLKSFFIDTYVFPGSIPDALAYFYRMKLGFDNPGRTVLELINALAVLLGCAGLFSIGSIRFSRSPLQTGNMEFARPVNRLRVLTAVCLGLIPALYLVFGSQWDMNPFRALPVLFLGLIVHCILSLNGRRERDPSARALLVVSVYALAVLIRIITRVPAGGGYGAGLLPVPLMLFFYMAVNDLSVFRVPPAAKRFRRLAVSIFLTTTLAVASGVIVHRYWNRSYSTVHTPRGDFSVKPSIGSSMSQALEYIARNSKPGEYILSLPEGGSLNFLADRPSPLRNEILTPGFLDRLTELDTIRTLEEKKVRLIFLFNRPTSEFGAKIFGKDYYRTLMGWIESGFELDAVFGDGVTSEDEIGSGPFFIKCYIKK
jgi:hypothetical protein